jgi:hypothetical protein
MSAGQTPNKKNLRGDIFSELMNKRRTKNVGLIRDLDSGAQLCQHRLQRTPVRVTGFRRYVYSAQKCDGSVAYAGVCELGRTYTHGVIIIRYFFQTGAYRRRAPSPVMLHWPPNTS